MINKSDLFYLLCMLSDKSDKFYLLTFFLNTDQTDKTGGDKNRKNTPDAFSYSASPLAVMVMSLPVSRLPAFSCPLSPTPWVKRIWSDKQ